MLIYITNILSKLQVTIVMGGYFFVILNIIYKYDRMHVIKMHILDYQNMSK
jgi:hypothetical protein